MTPEEITRMLENTSAKDVENLIKYLNIQKAEAEAVTKGTTNEEIVQNYLDNLIKYDPQLAEKYPTNNMNKGIKDCMDYINNLAQKTAAPGARMAAVNSFTVFEWAVRYFLQDEIEKFEKPKPAPYQPKAPTLQQKIDTLKQAKEKWLQGNKNKIDAWEIENNAKIDLWEKEHKLDLFPSNNPYANKVNPHLSEVFPQQEELDKLITEQNKKSKPEPTAEPEKTEPAAEPDNSDQEDEGDIIEEASEEELAELEN